MNFQLRTSIEGKNEYLMGTMYKLLFALQNELYFIRFLMSNI